MARKKVDALPVGQSPMGPGSTLKRIQCIRLTRLGASGLHLIYLLPLSGQQRIVCFKYFQLFQVLHWQPHPGPWPASVSLSRCQAARKGVRIVPVEYRESRREVQRGQCQWPVQLAGGGPGAGAALQCGRRGPGGAAALIGPDIGKYTISVDPDIEKHQE